ncbi:hypothetical protein H5087_15535 [Pseudoalteromonas sp. SR43-7]|uniref:hypothetical protein n=1 Tax=Pseudoalteromonas sp. SR43-7 TaxID=2760939 RepID=UPI0015FE3951|nr:hypothetical protein [Pseudoalteromonas sp. SR43-7]MBB1330764.1 hypothetical protein [Pseudoalteromonas sp. SR43-7]
MENKITLDKVFCQEDIHRFFLKTSVVVAAFLVTSILSQLFSLASNENKVYESKSVAQAEVDYYKSQKNLKQEDQLKLIVSQAKLNSANKAVETNESMLNLNKSITDLCMLISPGFFLIGIFFWLMHLPYIQTGSETSVNQANEETDQSPPEQNQEQASVQQASEST